MKRILLLLLLLLPSIGVEAATIYIDATVCSTGATKCSGTTDTTTATVSGTTAGPNSGATGDNTWNLDTNTNFAAVAGCSGGTCDQQQGIFINNSTTANRKLFWLVSYTGCTGAGACQVVLDTVVACTTCTATSDWGIGGRYTHPGTSVASHIGGASRPGDTYYFNNSPAQRTTVAYLAGVGSGTGAAGFVNITGAPGVVLNTTAVTVISPGNFTRISGITLDRDDTAGTTIALGAGSILENSTLIGGSNTVTAANLGIQIIGNNISGGNLACILLSTTSGIIRNNWIHGCTTNGVHGTGSTNAYSILSNLITGNVARGIFMDNVGTTSGAQVTAIHNNTISGNGTNNTSSGVEVNDSDIAISLMNNIIVNNGGTGGFNVRWTSGNWNNLSFHDYNVIWSSSCGGGAAGACVDNATGTDTLSANEVASDPQFTNAGGNDYSIPSTSPAYQTGVPGLVMGSSSTGYMSRGAVQPQATGGVGGGAKSFRPGFSN